MRFVVVLVLAGCASFDARSAPPGADAPAGSDGSDTRDAGVDSSPATCPPTYMSIPGLSHHYRSIITATAWDTANASCNADGPGNTYLVIPDDNAELIAVSNFTSADVFWIGVNDRATEGTFVNAKNAPQTFLPWATAEPDDAGVQDCVDVNTSEQFETDKCSTVLAAVCECDG